MTAETGYESEWREQVARQLEGATKANQETAVILERLKGQIDDHDKRLGKLENSPASFRTNFDTYGGCIAQIVFATFSFLGFIIAIVTLIITISHTIR